MTTDRMPGRDAQSERIAELEAENTRLRGLLGLDDPRRASPPAAWEPTLFGPDAPAPPAVDEQSAIEDKVALFRSLFAGRDDVYALRWRTQGAASRAGDRLYAVVGRTRASRDGSIFR